MYNPGTNSIALNDVRHILCYKKLLTHYLREMLSLS